MSSGEPALTSAGERRLAWLVDVCGLRPAHWTPSASEPFPPAHSMRPGACPNVPHGSAVGWRAGIPIFITFGKWVRHGVAWVNCSAKKGVLILTTFDSGPAASHSTFAGARENRSETGTAWVLGAIGKPGTSGTARGSLIAVGSRWAEAMPAGKAGSIIAIGLGGPFGSLGGGRACTSVGRLFGAWLGRLISLGGSASPRSEQREQK